MCHPVRHSGRKLSSGDISKIPLPRIPKIPLPRISKIPLPRIKFIQWFNKVLQTLKTAASNDDIHLSVLQGVYKLSLQLVVNKTPMKRCTYTIFV